MVDFLSCIFYLLIGNSVLAVGAARYTLKEIMKSERPARNIPTPRTIDDMYAVSKGFANTTIANNASKSGTVTVFHDNGKNFLDVNSTNN